jgi:hypothetical protein
MRFEVVSITMRTASTPTLPRAKSIGKTHPVARGLHALMVALGEAGPCKAKTLTWRQTLGPPGAMFLIKPQRLTIGGLSAVKRTPALI